MSDEEYEHDFARWRQLRTLERRVAVIEACRGSGNPALLAWLAEALSLDAATTVVDVGSWLGGPCAWLADRYRCRVLGAEPVIEGARGSASLFGMPSVAATGDALPLRTGAADVALLLGVLSAATDPAAVLREVGRVATAVGILAYVARADRPLHRGGSRFPPMADLAALLEGQGWEITAGPLPADLPPPPTWDEPTTETSGHGDRGDERDDEEDRDEEAVGRALAEGRIGICLLSARRAGPGSSGRARPGSG